MYIAGSVEKTRVQYRLIQGTFVWYMIRDRMVVCDNPPTDELVAMSQNHTCQQSSISANLGLLAAKSSNNVNQICPYKIAWEPSLRGRLDLGIWWIWSLWILQCGGRQSRWKYPIIGIFKRFGWFNPIGHLARPQHPKALDPLISLKVWPSGRSKVVIRHIYETNLHKFVDFSLLYCS